MANTSGKPIKKRSIKLDILAFAPHPDDAEEGCGGLLIKAKKAGQKVGIFDLTSGEMSENCTPRERQAEIKKATQKLGLDFRESLGLPDTRIENTFENRLKIITVLRKFQPQTILVPAEKDVHSDHVNTAHLITQAAFLSEMTTFKLNYPPFRPKQILYYFLNHEVSPTFILDVSQELPEKLAVLKTYKSQYSPKVLAGFEVSARYWGQKIGTDFGEPFWMPNPAGLSNLNNLITRAF